MYGLVGPKKKICQKFALAHLKSLNKSLRYRVTYHSIQKSLNTTNYVRSSFHNHTLMTAECASFDYQPSILARQVHPIGPAPARPGGSNPQ